MDKNKSAVEDFLEGVESDGIVQEENIFEQPLVKEEPIQEEKPLPFNKDPKIQKYLDKEITKRMEEMKSQVTPEKAPKEHVGISDDEIYYSELIGNDTPEKVAMIRRSIARDEAFLKQAEERAFNRLSQKEQEERLADKEAEDELESAFDTIEETFDVDITSNNPIAKKNRQEFVAFVEKIAPKDRNGDIVDYPDMTSAWETFQDIKKATPTPNRAKDLASRSMARTSEAVAAPQRKSNGQPFQSTDDFLDSLSK